MLSLAVLGLACSLLTASPTATPERPVATEPPTAAVEPPASASTASLSPTEQSLPEGETAPPPPGEKSRVADAELVAADQGWAWKGESLLWTADGGETWRDITPPGTEGEAIWTISFLDVAHGWVALSPPFERIEDLLAVRMVRTEDGGQTWQELSPFEANLPNGPPGRVEDLRFLDSQRGWMSIDNTVTMNSSTGYLFETADGGVTWRQRSLPNAGPVRFITPSVGWTIGSCCTGAPKQLYRTDDGGATWQQQRPAPNPGGAGDGYDFHDYSLPVFQNERQGVLAVTLRDERYEVTGVGFYRTSDSGESWQPAATFESSGELLPGSGIPITLQIVTGDHWVVVMPEALFVTRDGGGSWEQVQPAGLPAPSVGEFLKLEFADDRFGWGLFYWLDSVLLKTEDGGRSWSPVVVGP